MLNVSDIIFTNGVTYNLIFCSFILFIHYLQLNTSTAP